MIVNVIIKLLEVIRTVNNTLAMIHHNIFHWQIVVFKGDVLQRIKSVAPFTAVRFCFLVILDQVPTLLINVVDFVVMQICPFAYMKQRLVLGMKMKQRTNDTQH